MNEGGFGYEAALYDEIISGLSSFIRYSLLACSNYYSNSSQASKVALFHNDHISAGVLMLFLPELRAMS